MTEWPLKHTLGDIWSVVYDYECSAVVVLMVPPANSVSITGSLRSAPFTYIHTQFPYSTQHINSDLTKNSPLFGIHPCNNSAKMSTHGKILRGSFSSKMKPHPIIRLKGDSSLPLLSNHYSDVSMSLWPAAAKSTS